MVNFVQKQWPPQIKAKSERYISLSTNYQCNEIKDLNANFQEKIIQLEEERDVLY